MLEPTIALAATNDLQAILNFVGSNFVWIMIITVVTVAVIGGTLKEIAKTNARERSRREIAAYIAEGSMTPEQGERLMRAGRNSSEA